MARHVASLRLVGGRLCLDFANSTDWDGLQPVEDALLTFEDAIDWALHVGLLHRRTAEELRVRAASEPKQAADVVDDLKDWRRTIYVLFDELIGKGTASQASLDAANRLLLQTASAARLVQSAAGIACEPADRDLAAWLFGPIAWSLGDLLISGDLARVRRCPAKSCGWLFFDESRSGKRRWCSMDLCGNRAKSRAHYLKTRTQEQGS
jgi:predicted RNA-binding Zn ribbon-like protein